MGVALQDLHCIAVGDVIKADPIGCKDLIAHLDAMLFCKTTRVQPGEKVYDGVLTHTNTGDVDYKYISFIFWMNFLNCGHLRYKVIHDLCIK